MGSIDKIWVTSDTHFGHANIIKYCNRPYSSVGQMDTGLIVNINSLVAPEDTLIHGGDFCFGNYDSIINFRKRINCRHIHLVLGNHDRMIKANRFRLVNVFEAVEEYKVIKIGEKIYIINHYPINIERDRDKQAHMLKLVENCDAKYLFGHTHKDEPNNIGVDAHNYFPILLNSY